MELTKIGKIMCDICDNEEQAQKFIDALLIVINGTFRQCRDSVNSHFNYLNCDIARGNNREEWISVFRETKK